MSDMIRRQKGVPLQARRVEPQSPETIQIPGAGAIPVPPAGATQTIVYVNVPAGQGQGGQAAQPVPPAVPPGEIHLHTHVHHYPKRRRSGHGTSFLGTFALVVGGLACGTSYVPQMVWLARPIAMVGLGCAAMGFLGAVLFRRVGRMMPVVGLIVSGIGYGLWMVNSGQAKMEQAKTELAKVVRDTLQQAVASPSPTVRSAGDATAADSKPAAPTPQAAAPLAKDRTKLHDGSIFGDGGHWGNGTPPPSVVTPPVAAIPSVPASPTVDSATAAANLESARMAAAAKMGVDYAAAKSAAADAKTEDEQVRATASPGSPELQVAGERYLSAASNLAAIQKKLDADPSVAAAEQALKAARAAGK